MVTIIIPVYNAKLYIERTLESVLNQTYKNIQIILVDDGSTDNSRKICNKYAEQYSNIEVHYQENKGVSAARNLGMKKAAGTYIQFVDSDDYIERNMVESFVRDIEINKCDLVIGGYKNIDNSNGSVTSKKSPESILKGMVDKDRLLLKLGLLYNELLINAIWNKLYLKSIIDKHGIEFKEEIRRGEDLLFNLDYIDCCSRIYLSKNIGYNYVQYGKDSQSITSKFQDNIEYNEIFIYEKLKEFLLRNESYEGQNLIVIENKFIQNLLECIWYYFNFELEHHEIKNRIKKIMNILNGNQYYDNFKPRNLQGKILNIFIKYRVVGIVMLLAYTKKKMKRFK
ncbi:glycosyltransferase family 2 protein [Gracilibacillus sp. YIM 98692]|uniref:glycosyltransferase family 2 protein n=1 Tax=Gracilibacillus sp. YIM 98692 TaxID=2663532 RepID=UPI0013D27B6F|nr:glycosyltransferase family 2 protein [Gracilibacillus sp. YIM 98692]